MASATHAQGKRRGLCTIGARWALLRLLVLVIWADARVLASSTEEEPRRKLVFHGHRPHRHRPHGHDPHGHDPHGHTPHVHTPTPPPPAPWTNFWTWHILSEYFTGVANKDTANEPCEIPFVAYYCLGQDTKYSDYNTEEHVDNNVIEYIQVFVSGYGQYVSCCPPYAKKGGTNTGDYYRCNAWTTQDNNNCHTPGLPWNDSPPAGTAAVRLPGAMGVPGKPGQFIYSFPAEGEGSTWKQVVCVSTC